MKLNAILAAVWFLIAVIQAGAGNPLVAVLSLATGFIYLAITITIAKAEEARGKDGGASDPTEPVPLTLEAYAPDERRAFYSRQDGDRTRYYLLTDPDGRDREVTEGTVAHAVTVGGWLALRKAFTRPELVAFLRAESLRVWEELRGGKPAPTVDELRAALLRHLPPEAIEAAIGRAERELGGEQAARVERRLRSLLTATRLTAAQRRRIEKLLAGTPAGPSDRLPS